MNKLLASLIIAAASTLALNAVAATDKADEPAATAAHQGKKTAKSHANSNKKHSKKAEHKTEAKPADAATK